MEKAEQKWEQAEMEEHEEEDEEATLVVRKSRNGNNESQIADEVSGSNGVSESNEHSSNGAAENEDLSSANSENEQRNLEELDVVVEDEPEKAINGEQEKEALVYFDKLEGADSISTNFEEKQTVKNPGPEKLDISSLDFVVQNNVTSAINNRHEGDPENNDFSSPNHQPSQVSSLEHNTSYNNKPSNEIESADVDLINDDDLEVKEFDVERVIQKQTTHDLFCPNCNSCITRRVILQKRKRRIRVSDEEVKRNKTETAVESILSKGSVESRGDYGAVDDNDARLLTVDEDERERGPDIFRCLSCFSFFIPTGNGFKLFAFEKSEKDKIQGEQAPPSVKKNWFTSMFVSNKQETAVEQGSSFKMDVQKDEVRVVSSSNLGEQSGQPSFVQKAPSPSRASQGLVGTYGNNDNSEGGDQILPSSKQKPSFNADLTNGARDKSDVTRTETVDTTMEQLDSNTGGQLKESKSRKEVQVSREIDSSLTTRPTRTQVTNGESAENATSLSQQGGLKLLISSKNESPALESSGEGRITNQRMQSGGADKDNVQLSPTPVIKGSDVDGKLNISVSIPHEDLDVRATILTESVLENKNTNFGSIDHGQVYPTEASQHIITKTKFEVHSGEPLKVDNTSVLKDVPVPQGKDTVITIDSQPAGLSQNVEDITSQSESASLLQPLLQSSVAGIRRTEEREEHKIEVIKSIVYGGLAESITSLSVVSSAAGGGAATLNILALGMANLIGGLFVICHNLWELKCDRVEQVTNQISDELPEQRDRYKELLGRRQNFILHAIVAIISYIVFGLVPPIVYGFSFRKTDDKQLKLVAVGGASLLCIVVLAIGRAYVRRPPKPYLKSIVTFVILGFTVSGVSYAAGELVERLLEKLGVFQMSSASNLLVNEMMRPKGSAWASY